MGGVHVFRYIHIFCWAQAQSSICSHFGPRFCFRIKLELVISSSISMKRIWRQDSQSDLQSQDDGGDRNRMGKWLVSQYKRAKISANQLIEGCQAERASNAAASAAVRRVAALDPETKNASRDLRRVLSKEALLPEPYTAEVPMWDTRRARPVVLRMSFMPIHEVMGLVVHENAHVDFCKFVPHDVGLERRLQETCDRAHTSRTNTSSLAIWGDFAKYLTRDSICLLLWSFRTGTLRKRFWICAFGKRQACNCGCGGRHTFSAIFRIVGWMLRTCLTQKWPTHRHDGVAFKDSTHPGDQLRALLAGCALPCKGIVTHKAGDWSWLKQALGLTGWFSVAMEILALAGCAMPIA